MTEGQRQEILRPFRATAQRWERSAEVNDRLRAKALTLVGRAIYGGRANIHREHARELRGLIASVERQ